jgi:hypothetical protein
VASDKFVGQVDADLAGSTGNEDHGECTE